MANNKIIDLERLTRFKDKLDNVLETKANVDGNYPTMTVGSADALTPYGENSGANDTTPFVLQTTGGSSDVGSKAYLRELRGNSVALNQEINHGQDTATNNYVTFTNNNDGSWTANGTATGGNAIKNVTSIHPQFIAGHKYLVKGCPVGGSNTTYELQIGGGTIDIREYGSGTIYTATSTNTTSVWAYLLIREGVIANNLKFVPQLFDLTLMFGAGNEPTNVLEFNRLFPKPYYEYNAGELLSCKVNGIKNVGYNALSLDRTQGTLSGFNSNRTFFEDKYYVGLNRINYYSANSISNLTFSSNSISFSTSSNGYGIGLPKKIIPGLSYTASAHCITNPAGKTSLLSLSWYDINGALISADNFENTNEDKELTSQAPNNAYWCVVNVAGRDDATLTTFTDICFHLTWDSSRTGYEPYEKWQYALPNIELKSAGSVYDVAYSTGGGKRRVGSYTFTGEETWLDYDGGGYSLTTVIFGMKSYESSELANVKWALGITIKAGSRSPSLPEYTICVNQTGRLFVMTTKNATQLNSALAGKTIYFELTTETDITTEENPGWQNPQDIDDFGTQEFLYDNDITIPIPQGNEFFYPVDYKAFIDSLGGREDIEYDASEIVSHTELSEYTYSSLDIRKYALKYALTSSKDLNPDKIEVIDLYSLSFSYDSTYQVFTASLNDYNYGTRTNILCEKYQVVSTPYTSMANLCITGNGGEAKIHIKNTSYTNATTFKNAMKGVLLAYEKA